MQSPSATKDFSFILSFMIRLKFLEDPEIVVLTCSELSTIQNPSYLFVLTNAITKQVTTGTFKDESKNKSRYNLFKAPRSFFPSSGWFDLEVYEMQSEDTTGGLVEQTKVFVEFDSAPLIKENTLTNIEKEYKEYDGN
jgi:hypothetical protein